VAGLRGLSTIREREREGCRESEELREKRRGRAKEEAARLLPAATRASTLCRRRARCSLVWRQVRIIDLLLHVVSRMC